MSQSVLDRPLASWEDQTTTITTSWEELQDPSVQLKPGGVGLGNLHRKGTNYKPLSEPATPPPPPPPTSSSSLTPAIENAKRNVLQTNAFKSAIAALGSKQPHIPTHESQRDNVVTGAGWDTSPLLKTQFWTGDNENTTTNIQQQQQQQFQQPQQSPQIPQDNVLAVFDISFVDDSETGISIKQNHEFRPIEMSPEKSNDSFTNSIQPTHTTPTSINSYTRYSSVRTNDIPGSNASIWVSSSSDKQQQKGDGQRREKEHMKKTNNNTTKWNPKAQAFQFDFPFPSSSSSSFINESDGSDKPVTPIFEFAKPSEEPETPFFNFTSRNNQPSEAPLFNFSTALNPAKARQLSISSSARNNKDDYEEEEESEYEDEYEEEEDDNVVSSSTTNANDLTFTFPVTKKISITSPHTKKPNPEAAEFTPTISKAILIKSPTASSTTSIKSTTTTATWNPKVTEFVPTSNDDLNIPSFVVRPKSTRIEIKTPDQQESDMMSPDGGLQSQTQPETTRGLEEPIPVLQITISFAPGVTSILSVFENDEPKKVVASFCRKHNLAMTNNAQLSFVNTITKLKHAKLTSLSKKKN